VAAAAFDCSASRCFIVQAIKVSEHRGPCGGVWYFLFARAVGISLRLYHRMDDCLFTSVGWEGHGSMKTWVLVYLSKCDPYKHMPMDAHSVTL
jgi:hypothetical protein